jgi:putative transposase
MQALPVMLPNHLLSIYKQMRPEVEEKVFKVDLKEWMKRMLEDVSLAEFEELVIGTSRYDRKGPRQNYRNGFYERSLDTVLGWIEDLKIPRPRKGGFKPSWLEKHARRQESLNRLATECFIRGVSTRDVNRVFKVLCDVEISSSTVSRLTSQWDKEVNHWHRRKLTDDYLYLMFDGIWIKNRSLLGKKRLVLVAYGIKNDLSREIIDYVFAQSESEENWLKFLTCLAWRGLEGKGTHLITTDGSKGLSRALEIVYPGVSHQLCWAHKMRNILKSVKESDKHKVKTGLSPLFTGVWTQKQAGSLIHRWARQWKNNYPKAVQCLERDLDRLLLYLECDPAHHQAIRTSNHIERQFKEYRRRMKPMEIIPNKQSADRILYALTQIRNQKLREHPIAFTHNSLR